MTETAAKLMAHGNDAFKHGRWRDALASFGGVVVAAPHALRARVRIGDALLNLGKKDLAREVYASVAAWGALHGQPLTALVAAKMAQLVDPTEEDALTELGALYSCESTRVDVERNVAPEVPVGDVVARAITGEGDVLLHEAAAVAARFETRGAAALQPERLPAIPFLSLLDEEGFAVVVDKLKLRRFAPEELIVREGERGESFFVVADGDVHVKRDVNDDDGGVVLARLHPGALFGELALISEEPRHAAVIADGDVDAFEFRCADVIVAAAMHPTVGAALRRFTRERFLRNLTATHPFFSGLSRSERHEVMARFEVKTMREGTPLIREGEQGPGLYVLLGGRASVDRESGIERVHLATLRGGDVCGEMSLLSDLDTNATVTCVEDLEALFLPRTRFRALTRDHPGVVRYLAELSEERSRSNRALLLGHGLLEDDEHVMI